MRIRKQPRSQFHGGTAVALLLLIEHSTPELLDHVEQQLAALASDAPCNRPLYSSALDEFRLHRDANADRDNRRWPTTIDNR